MRGDHCTNIHDYHNVWPGTALVGTVVGSQPVTSGGVAACCAAGDSAKGAEAWSFVGASASSQSGTCYFFVDITDGKRQSNATSGEVIAVVSIHVDDLLLAAVGGHMDRELHAIGSVLDVGRCDVLWEVVPDGGARGRSEVTLLIYLYI